MEERRNLIMGTFMVTSSTRNYLLNRNKNPLIKGTLIMNREIRNMHKTFELKTRRKWNTQQTICEWEDIISKDFVGMTSDYVDI